MSISLELTQGTARDFPFQITNPDGTAATQFLNTDVLTASVWAGSNEAALLTPAVSWLNSNAPAGQIQISLQNTDSASLAVGEYYLQAVLRDPGRHAGPDDGAPAARNFAEDPGGPGRDVHGQADVHLHRRCAANRPLDR